MAELRFSQAERRNFAVPMMIAVLVLAVALGLFYWLTPHRVAELSVTRVAVLPEHTVFPGNSIKVGAQDQAQDDFYVVAQVRIHDNLKLPIFINGLTGEVTTFEGAKATANAVETRDVETLYNTFPKLRQMTGKLLPRETEIPPGGTVEGSVLLDFPITQTSWDARLNATITIDTYHQGPLTVTIPK